MKDVSFLIGLAMLLSIGVLFSSSAQFRPLSPFINAIIQVESEGRRYVPGACGELGPLQISPICLEDINQIRARMGYEYSFTSMDCFSRSKSVEMFYFYTDYWIEEHELDPTDENRARIWNGGPRGWEKSSTKAYWQKVQRAMVGS